MECALENMPVTQLGSLLASASPRDPLSPEVPPSFPFCSQLLVLSSLLSQSASEKGLFLPNTEAGDDP